MWGSKVTVEEVEEEKEEEEGEEVEKVKEEEVVAKEDGKIKDKEE